VPLPPLQVTTSLPARVRGVVSGITLSSVLLSSLLAVNALQTCTLPLRIVWRNAFRRLNRFAADTWWGWCVSLAHLLYGVRVVVSGDNVQPRENVIVIANHQQMTDITFAMFLARAKGRLGDMKWFVKDIIKWVPGVGWGMFFLDCLFVKRRWADDERSIRATFSAFIREKIPVWLISFVEGTRLTERKLAQSQEYARSQGLPLPHHTLVPRLKGFVASVQGLREHVDAVYDVTIGYVGGVPNLWQYIRGEARLAHLHVRRFPIASLPQAEAELGQWLMARWQEKDQLLETFYRSGSFTPTAAANA
jgi:1-acyl-sn-glycerol-3-phosphate acyltransferase